MDANVRAAIQKVVALVKEGCAKEFAAAGTLMDLEELTVAIGDEMARQLCEEELKDRAERASKLEMCECPECGALCPQGELEPSVVQGLRGEIVFNQPGYFCRRCRRSFFPSGGPLGTRGPGHGDALAEAEDGVGGEQPREL